MKDDFIETDYYENLRFVLEMNECPKCSGEIQTSNHYGEDYRTITGASFSCKSCSFSIEFGPSS